MIVMVQIVIMWFIEVVVRKRMMNVIGYDEVEY